MRRSQFLIPFVVLLALGGLWLWWSGGSPQGNPRELREDPAERQGAPERLPVDPAEALQEAGQRTGGAQTRRAPVPEAHRAEAPSVAPDGERELLVVEADGRTPRVGFAVRVVLCAAEGAGEGAGNAAGRRVEWTTTLETDAEGRANLEQLLEHARDAEWVRCFPARDLGLRLEPTEVRIDALSAAPSVPTVLRLRARETAAVHALAVDASTGEPLPQFALRTQRWIDIPNAGVPVRDVFSGGFSVAMRGYDGTECEWVITDAAGRFTTERAYPAGRLGFLTLDQERAELQHDGRTATEPIRLEVPVGPLVRLAFVPGSGRTALDYVAGLWRAPEELVTTDGAREYPSPWSRDRGRRAGRWGNAAPVQVDGPAGGGAFVRLTQEQATDPLPSFLFLLSRDGASFGFASLETYERYRDEPLFVHLEERDALACVIVWPEGAGEGADLEVLLFPLDDPAGVAREVPVDRMPGEQRTEFQFQLLQPGSYRVAIEAGVFEELQQDVGVPRSGAVALRPRVAEPEQLHLAEFRIESDSGQPPDGREGRAHLRGLYLWAIDAAGQSFKMADAKWAGGVGHVRIEGLRAGTYQYEGSWVRGAHVIEPGDKLVRVPGPPYVLRVRDRGPTVRAEVRILSPPDEGTLVVTARGDGGTHVNERFQLGPEDGREQSPDGRAQLTVRTGPIDAGMLLDLRLESEAHRIVMLADEAFSPPDLEGVRRLEILSSPGFGARIRVWAELATSGEGRPPVPGLVLTLDGIEQAPTDLRGVLNVSSDKMPQRIGVASPGWRLVTRTSWEDWGSVFADTGRFTVEDGRLDVFLESTDE